jgi:hypothetical protein
VRTAVIRYGAFKRRHRYPDPVAFPDYWVWAPACPCPYGIVVPGITPGDTLRTVLLEAYRRQAARHTDSRCFEWERLGAQ